MSVVVTMMHDALKFVFAHCNLSQHTCLLNDMPMLSVILIDKLVLKSVFSGFDCYRM